jgi:hypothetical protein
MDNQNQIMAQQQIMGPQMPQTMSAKDFAAKYQSKREVYLFFTLNCQAYLPRYENITIYFLKDIVNGLKR